MNTPDPYTTIADDLRIPEKHRGRVTDPQTGMPADALDAAGMLLMLARIDLDRCKLTAGQRTVPRPDGDVLLEAFGGRDNVFPPGATKIDLGELFARLLSPRPAP